MILIFSFLFYLSWILAVLLTIFFVHDIAVKSRNPVVQGRIMFVMLASWAFLLASYFPSSHFQ